MKIAAQAVMFLHCPIKYGKHKHKYIISKLVKYCWSNALILRKLEMRVAKPV
jgi:hypothetical protein